MKKIILIGLVMLLSVFMLVGCGGGQEPAADENPEEGAPQEEVLSGSVVIAGSTSVQPLSEELAAAFMDKYPEISVEVQGGGSSVGVKSADNGVADIGAASRE